MRLSDYDTGESVDQVDGGDRTDSRMKLKRNTTDEVEEDDEEEKEEGEKRKRERHRLGYSTSECVDVIST